MTVHNFCFKCISNRLHSWSGLISSFSTTDYIVPSQSNIKVWWNNSTADEYLQMSTIIK